MSNDDKYFLKWFIIVQIFVLTFILISKNLLQDIFKDDRDKTTKNCIFQNVMCHSAYLFFCVFIPALVYAKIYQPQCLVKFTHFIRK